MPFDVTFWGTRGSLPTSGPKFSEVGGNTSCVQVDLPDRVLLFDAGTGIRLAGDALARDDRPVSIVLTHPHWDHIQGLPFFWPLYTPGKRVEIVVPGHADWAETALGQADGRRFPVDTGAFRASITIQEDLEAFAKTARLDISVIEANHPGPCLGYRIHTPAGDLIFLTDNELRPPSPGPTSFQEFVAFCSGADLLIHDAQFVEDDLAMKAGWGHSTVSQALDLALAARVGSLALFHHDPDRTDGEIISLTEEASREALNAGVSVFAATDGLRVPIRPVMGQMP